MSVGIAIKRLAWQSQVLGGSLGLSFILMCVGIYLTFSMGLVFRKAMNLTSLLGVSVPALGLSFGYFFAKISMLPLPVCKTVAIEGGVLNSFLAPCHYSAFLSSLMQTWHLWLHLQWPCVLHEMLLILLFYRKGVSLTQKKKRMKIPSLTVKAFLNFPTLN